ncbi:MAG: hypothetical protein BZY88_17770 [SAR202 cluster bacterium Io17-Chloro-G9]|nr:MAG: hypothetical protein BZY88_17770 [SAR202 cluster bacterium Io17-Chloro-G9]
MPYFEDLELGDEIGPLEIEASDAQVSSFCRIWDRETPSRFTDPEVAKKTGLPGPIVPGIMTLAMMTRLFTDWAGPGVLKDLDVVFRQPVPHNKPLAITATITDTRQENGENVIECDVLMTGTSGERYVGGKAILSVPGKP